VAFPRRYDEGNAPPRRAGAPAFPVTIYYAFKQSETESDEEGGTPALGGRLS